MTDPKHSRSLFVVGDDAQSIYGFRGSKVEIILNFESEYPGTEEIILNQNYRSTQPILNLAEQILSHNPHQKKKDLFTENKDEIDVVHYHASSDRDEAEYIIRRLQVLYGQAEVVEEAPADNISFEPDEMFERPQERQKPPSSNPVSNMFDVYLDIEEFGAPSPISSSASWDSWKTPVYDWKNMPQLNDCVILYRTHSQSRSLEETFLKYNLPYRLVAGVKFLERREIKDVLSMLRWLRNGDDKLSLSRFLPILLEGVGTKTLEKIFAYLEDETYPLPPKHSQQLNTLLFKLQSLWSHNSKLADMTKELIYGSGYTTYLKREFPSKDQYQARLENINELYSLMLPFDEDETLALPDKLKAFLDKISLMTTAEEEVSDKESPKINLMSLHQSKGLEFETVFLVGVEDGLLPHQNSFFEPDGLAEEVRLAYVGVTRAKKHLYLISCQSRIQFGQVKANPISRIFRPFLDKYCRREIR